MEEMKVPQLFRTILNAHNVWFFRDQSHYVARLA